MSARAYFLRTVNDCKDVSSLQEVQSRQTSLLCLYTLIFLCALYSQNKNKQIVKMADENLSDYSCLSRYHYTKSKKYLKRQNRNRH